MTDIDAMKLALFALDIVKIHYTQSRHINEAITALKERLAQPKQEPVAWMDVDGNVSDNNDHKCFPIPLYTTPPQRNPLTHEQRQELMSKAWNKWLSNKDDGRLFAWDFSFEVEAAHGIKGNT